MLIPAQVVDWSSLFREGFYQASSSMPALGKYEDADSRPNSGDTIHGSSFLASSPRPSLDQSRARHLSKFTTTNGSVHSFGDPFSSQLSLARSDKSIKAFKGGLFHSLRNIRSRIDLKKSSPSLQ